MKTKLLLMPALFSFIIGAAAQPYPAHPLFRQSQVDQTARQILISQLEHFNGSLKATGTPERMMAYSFHYFLANGNQNGWDSVKYSYSGTRGSRFLTGAPYLESITTFPSLLFYPWGDYILDFTKSYVDYDSAFHYKNAPIPIDRYTKVYTASNKVQQFLFTQLAAGINIKSQSRFRFMFNANGDVLELAGDTAQIPFSSNYDQTGSFIISYQGQMRKADSAFSFLTGKPTEKTIYTYSSSLIQQILYLIWDGGNQWINSDRFSYTYDNSGRLITSLREEWINNNWVNADLDSFLYQGSNGFPSYQFEQVWNTNTWQNQRQTFYSLNSNGIFDSSVGYTWNAPNWVLRYRDYATHNQNDHVISESLDYFLANGSISSKEIVYYYYEPISTGISGINLNSGLSVYPNPAELKFVISMPGLEKEADLVIVNGCGRLMLQATIKQKETEIDGSSFAKGIYFIRIRCNGSVRSEKLIIQ